MFSTSLTPYELRIRLAHAAACTRQDQTLDCKHWTSLLSTVKGVGRIVHRGRSLISTIALLHLLTLISFQTYLSENIRKHFRITRRSDRFCLFRYYKYEQKLSSLFWKIEFKDIIMEDIDSTETDIKMKVRGVYFNIFASRFD